MTLQYLPKIEVIIGDKDSANTPDALRITDLRVDFKIEKDILGSPVVSRVSITNLNEDTRSQIEEKNNKILVNAGYVGSMKLLFSGNILYVFHRYTPTEVITDIYAGDGSFSYLNSFFAKTYAQTVTNKQIITDAVNSFEGLSAGTIEGVPETESTLYGSTYFDLSHKVMNKLTNNLDLMWYIENESVNVLPKNGALGGEPIEFNALNGMIGSPTVTEIGINLQVLLRPDLVPGANFRVLSRSPNIVINNYYFKGLTPTKGAGTYRINKLIHIGDTHGTTWQTFIEGFILI